MTELLLVRDNNSTSSIIIICTNSINDVRTVLTKKKKKNPLQLSLHLKQKKNKKKKISKPLRQQSSVRVRL